MKLYEIVGEYNRVLELAVDEETGEVSEEFEQALEALGGALESKLVGCAKIMRQMDVDIAGIESEEARLAKKRKSMLAAKEKLCNYMASAMVATGTSKLNTKLFNFSVSEPKKRVEILEGAEVDEAYLHPQKDPPPRAPDKNAIRKALQAGKKLGFAVLMDGKRTLRVT